jgi:UDP-N-acetylmuramate--alanine ligase
MFRGRAQKLHFVGIGGIGMSGIAEVLLNLGYDVRGSDLRTSDVTQRLDKLGATIFEGHHADHVKDADVVVTSSAVPDDNPEIMAARRTSVAVIRRAEMLAELMRLKYGIAVAGSHGKTTTTSLVATMLGKGKLDPTVVVGGRIKSVGSNAKLGTGEYLVAEADESDGSFLKLMPTIAVVTNIDKEHLDHWHGGIDEIIEAFLDFINKVPFYGVSVLCVDHPNVRKLLPRVDKRYLSYGYSTQADYCAESVKSEDGRMRFQLKIFGEDQGEVVLNMIGRHNVHNALAAIAVADEVGIPLKVIKTSLEDFEGIARRFEVKGCVEDILIADDYGHHPEEIKATLSAARDAYSRRLLVVFQPHRFSRTRDLYQDFVTAFDACHTLLITDIYAASEEAIEGIHSENLVASIKKLGHHDVSYCASLKETGLALRQRARAGDLVLTLGAGDVGWCGDNLLQHLAAQNRREVST